MEILRERRKRLLKELEWTQQEIKKEEEFLKKHTKELKCPRCGGDSWKVYTSYSPFKRIAYERRTIKFVCIDCGFEWIEEAQTETN